jgi:hypothetical protein
MNLKDEGMYSEALGLPQLKSEACMTQVPNRRQSWQRLVVAVAARVRHWSARDLTLLGRVYVAKQLMASTITHLASFIPPPPTQL